MFNIIRLCLGTIARLFCARRSLLLENLVLRQQLAVFKRRHPRPRLNLLDKLFWVAASQVWSDWKQFLIVVFPETAVHWHRAGFRLYWSRAVQSLPAVCWPTPNLEGDSGFDLPDGCGKSELGRTSDSR
jgi:hypothetical protein